MTEVEAASLAQSLFSNANDVYSIFLTILGGYLLVAHLAGKTLTTSQLVIITSLYLPTMAYTIFEWHGFFQTAMYYSGIAAEHRGSYNYSSNEDGLILGLVINGLIALAPLKYMWDTRH
jgi:hypothetical protein